MKAKAELDETRELVRTVYRFVQNYREYAPRSQDEGAMRKAAGRVEEALTDCLREAIGELHEGGDLERAIAAVSEEVALERLGAETLKSGNAETLKCMERAA